ncbi:MAG: Rrf2 family transcriptional regulator [Ignavibacteria bacterium]|jgi:Rrf2 family protein|nr:Rrf2 family transcriptional regulator [Ignavibacteria bacterium]MDP3830768.1 Rrf2 family transcriptional regulator [Ignavibacteriaceae bacterium]
MKKNSLFNREHDYSLRITAFLASLDKDEIINVSSISKKLHLSKIFTARIIHKLRVANIVGSVQGKYGGFYLKANSEEISIWDVLNAMGYKVRLNDCMDENFFCDLMFGCQFHTFFIGLEQNIFEQLKQQKISDYIFRFTK